MYLTRIQRMSTNVIIFHYLDSRAFRLGCGLRFGFRLESELSERNTNRNPRRKEFSSYQIMKKNNFLSDFLALSSSKKKAFVHYQNIKEHFRIHFRY